MAEDGGCVLRFSRADFGFFAGLARVPWDTILLGSGWISSYPFIMIVTAAALTKVAYGRFAVGAYNINNAEQALGLFRGCLDSEAPFIVQISRGARNYTDKRMLEAILRAAEALFPEAVFAVHLDHGDEETCMDCIDSGFYSSVMIDASSGQGCTVSFFGITLVSSTFVRPVKSLWMSTPSLLRTKMKSSVRRVNFRQCALPF